MIPALILLSNQTDPIHTDQAFNSTEIKQILAYWQDPDRHVQTDLHPDAPNQPLQSAKGAKWLYEYYKKREPGVRLSPKGNPAPKTQRHSQWDQWIAKIYQEDRERAQSVSQSLNDIEKGFFGPPIPELPRQTSTPADLKALAGDPPSFFDVEKPQSHLIRFTDTTVSLSDGPSIRDGYPFLRNTLGVANVGTPVSDANLNALTYAAGLDGTIGKVMQAVSNLEGGFDSVNTYDTGLISVGFIQFACLENGSGALGRLLQSYKTRQPATFQTDFRQFGIDVTAFGHLVAIHPETGEELVGARAAETIAADKRLTAVFQRAGKNSRPYQIEQLRMAQRLFDPRFQKFTATINGQSFNIFVNDVIRSEAGLATIMDRLINTGSIGDLANAVTALATETGAKTISDVARYEDVLIGNLSYRRDFTKVATLNRPASSLSYSSVRPKSSISGSLNPGLEPMPVFPGFNVEISAQPGAPEFNKNGLKSKPSSNTKSPTVQKAEPNETKAVTEKPDDKVGMPITAVGG